MHTVYMHDSIMNTFLVRLYGSTDNYCYHLVGGIAVGWGLAFSIMLYYVKVL